MKNKATWIVLSTSLLLLGWAILAHNDIRFQEPGSKLNNATLGKEAQNLLSFTKKSTPPNPTQETSAEQETKAVNTAPSVPAPITLSTAGGNSRYMMRGKNSAAFFTPQGLSMSLLKPKEGSDQEDHPEIKEEEENQPSDTPDGWAIHWELVGANEVDPVPGGELPGKVNIYGSEQELTNLTTYSEVRYEDVYEGIDLTMESVSKGVKYTLDVAAGIDPSIIRMTYRGAESIQKNGDGTGLIIATGLGDIEENELYVYQTSEDGTHTRVDAWYTNIRQGTDELSWEYQIQIGNYDPEQPLVIDPTVTWSTYLGGAIGSNANTYAQGIGINDSSVFLCGRTSCTDFPPTTQVGAYAGGSYDAFVAKVDLTGGSGGWVTYIGGTGTDYAEDLALTSTEIIVVGYTSSSTALSSPVNSHTGSYDTFVVKFSTSGSGDITTSTYFGGTSSDYPRAIAVDSSDDIYITGYTYSSEITYGDTFTNPIVSTPELFVAKLGNDLDNTAGNAWVDFHTGPDYDYAYDIAVKADGTGIAIAGYTKSTTDFATDPGTSGAYSDTFAGGTYDTFVGWWTGSVFDYGTAPQWLTYLGGNGTYEYARGIKVDGNNDIVVMGYTNAADFPTTAGVFQDAMAGTSYDLFITKFASTGGLLWSTFLGGSSSDYGYDLAVNSDDDIIVTGNTYSSTTVATPFPTGSTTGAQPTTGSSQDAFFAILKGDGATLITSSYCGGDWYEYSYAIGVNQSDNSFAIAGRTQSSDLPGAPNDLTGMSDAFVAIYNSNGSTLNNALYVGGAVGALTPESGESISADDAGNIYVSGYTSATDFVSAQTTTNTGAFDVYGGDKADGWVTKITSGGTLDWVTYLGGSGVDYAKGIVAGAGNSPEIFVAGYTGTKTPPFISDHPPILPIGSPNIVPPWQTNHQGGTYDGFLTKMKPTGEISWSIFVGGSSTDYVYDVALDSSGNPHVGGRTYSDNLTGGNYSTQSSEFFITKVSTTGATPAFTYVHKGDDYDTLYEIAVDSGGNVFATGYTDSAITFTGGSIVAQDTYQGGNYDAWVAKVSSAGNLVWATYLGGDDYDYGYALAEKSGDVFVLGKTGSETISGASPYTWQGGGWDGFVAKYKSTGALSFFTYFGGSSLDYAEDIALYGGDAYLTGWTYSSNFPASNLINTPPGSYDIFVSKMSLSSTNVGTITSTDYFGGTGYDYARAIAVDSSGNILVTGNTTSDPFSGAGGGQITGLAADYDAFIMKLDGGLTSIAPVIGSSQTSLTFNAVIGSPNPADQTITISNTGNATLNWTAAEVEISGGDWLSIYGSSGSAPASSSSTPDMTVSVDFITPSVLQGTYDGTITITDAAATNSPFVISVTLNVDTTPTTTNLSLSPTNLNFYAEEGGSNPASQSTTLTNTGTSTLAWSVSSITTSNAGSWLTTNPASGTGLSEADTTDVTIFVDTTGLTEGIYTGTITVSDIGTTVSDSVNVSLTVSAPSGGTGSGTQAAPASSDNKNPVSCFGAATGLSGNSLFPLALAFLGLGLLVMVRRNF